MKNHPVALNKALKILVKIPRWISASQAFVFSDVPNLQAVLRNYMYNLMCRLSDSRNTLIMVINNTKLSDKLFILVLETLECKFFLSFK